MLLHVDAICWNTVAWLEAMLQPEDERSVEMYDSCTIPLVRSKAGLLPIIVYW